MFIADRLAILLHVKHEIQHDKVHCLEYVFIVVTEEKNSGGFSTGN